MKRSYKMIRVSSAGMPEHLAALCPYCETICSLILILGKRRKRDMGLFWKCGTLDCKFKSKVKLENYVNRNAA